MKTKAMAVFLLLAIAACGGEKTTQPASSAKTYPIAIVLWEGQATDRQDFADSYQAMKQCVENAGRLEEEEIPRVYVYDRKTYCFTNDGAEMADGCAFLDLNSLWVDEQSFNHGYLILNHEFVHLLAKAEDGDPILPACAGI